MIVGTDLESIIAEHFKEAAKQFPELEQCKSQSGTPTVEGELRFKATRDQDTIDECFSVRISFPDDYPLRPPYVEELWGRIPRYGTKAFHTYGDTGHLCLGAPPEVSEKFARHPTLRDFIEKQLIPYLFLFVNDFKEGTIELGPEVERSHGAKGMLEFYVEWFGVKGHVQALALLKFIVEYGYRGHMACPCGSGKRLRSCHGEVLKPLHLHRTHDGMCVDLVSIYLSLPESERHEIPFQASLLGLIEKLVLESKSRSTKTRN